MADKYIYAVARIRSKELSLLSGAFLEQLTAAKSYDQCIQLLHEKGWGGRYHKSGGAFGCGTRENLGADFGACGGPVGV